MAEKELIKIDNWAVLSNATPYTAPELISFFLHGKVKNHPKFTDDEFVRTSSIVDVDGNIVTTQSGSKYELGTVDLKYLEYIKKRHPDWDPDVEPIRMRKI